MRETVGERLQITRSQWGFQKITAESDAGFLRPERQTMTTDSFAGSTCELNLIVDYEMCIRDRIYVVYAPKTFILKFCIGLITGLVAHRIGKIDQATDQAYVARWTVLASVCGLVFNVIFDPLFGYFYKRVILGKAAADVTLAWNITATSINAVLSVIVASAVYLALRPALRKAHLAI